jgi:hypothetical protein
MKIPTQITKKITKALPAQNVDKHHFQIFTQKPPKPGPFSQNRSRKNVAKNNFAALHVFTFRSTKMVAKG